MLADAPVQTIIPVTNLARSEKFYGETLGLKRVSLPMPGYVRFVAGGRTALCLYERGPTATEHTLAGFTVPNLEATMHELRSRGVKFEDYDFPGFKTENGILSDGTIRSAWFKDPDGNILCIDEMPVSTKCLYRRNEGSQPATLRESGGLCPRSTHPS
jgi:catechol 2,3-dioxygenase-like lactoylglutathione lyase family enzyme